MVTIKRTQFAKHEVLITRGEFTTLEGWWNAANECRIHFTKENGNANPAEYARLASKVAKDNTESTIRKMVSYVVKAQEAGDTMDKFKGIGHLVAAYSGTGQREVADKKAVKSVRFTSARKEELATILRRAKVSDMEIASLFAFGTLGK